MTLAETAYREIRDKIISLEFAPGDAISERVLSVRLGYGITPVREALTRLRAERFVESAPRVGSRVTTLSVVDMVEIIDLWAVVSAELYWQGVPRLTDEEREQIERLARLADQGRPQAEDRSEDWTSPAGSIFEILGRAASNSRLAAVARHVEAEVQRVFALLEKDPRSSAQLRGAGLPSFPSLDPECRDGGVTSMRDFHSRVRDVILAWGGDAALRDRRVIGPSTRD